MGNNDWDLATAFERWMMDLHARRARGDDKAVLRGLYDLRRRLEEFAKCHPELRDKLPLDELREALVEEFEVWQQQRGQ